MNTDQTPPPEVTAPAGHEIVTPEFLREHGAVEGLLWTGKEFLPDTCWRPSEGPREEGLTSNVYSAPLGTMIACLTPAPAGFRNVLPGWLAGLETKPEGLLWSTTNGVHWNPCPLRWPFPNDGDEGNFAYAVPVSAPKFHNPDNLESAGEPPWRFLVEGEPKPAGCQMWIPGDDEWVEAHNNARVHPKITYRTRRPLSQKGGDEPCATSKQDEPVVPSQSSTSTEPASPAAPPVASNAAPTFQPDARPWLPIAEYDREKHGEWVEGRWLAPSLHQGVRKIHWNTHHRRWQDEHEFVYFNGVPTHFRPLPTPSVPTSGTPRCDAAVTTINRPMGVADFVNFARTLEKELASVTAELSQWKGFVFLSCEHLESAPANLASDVGEMHAELLELREKLLAAQTRADVAEQKKDMAKRNAVLDFAEQVLHGDQEHRNWLGAAAVAFVHGQPLPEPNGKGRAEAAEAERDTALIHAHNLRSSVRTLDAELAELKAKLSTPPTAALPLLDWLEAQPAGVLLECDGSCTITTGTWQEGASKTYRGSSLRAAIRDAITK